MDVYAPAQIITAPAQLITGSAQPPPTELVVYTVLLVKQFTLSANGRTNGQRDAQMDRCTLDRPESRYGEATDLRFSVPGFFLFTDSVGSQYDAKMLDLRNPTTA